MPPHRIIVTDVTQIVCQYNSSI